MSYSLMSSFPKGLIKRLSSGAALCDAAVLPHRPFSLALSYNQAWPKHTTLMCSHSLSLPCSGSHLSLRHSQRFVVHLLKRSTHLFALFTNSLLFAHQSSEQSCTSYFCLTLQSLSQWITHGASVLIKTQV